jgi:hypothetical protein
MTLIQKNSLYICIEKKVKIWISNFFKVEKKEKKNLPLTHSASNAPPCFFPGDIFACTEHHLGYRRII